MDKLYLVMPAYNEEANIEAVIESWYPILEGKDANSKLVVADSGSNDRTHQILLKLQKKYSKLEIISDTAKFHGPKLMALYDYAIKKHADYIFQTDSDGQTDPSEFEAFWQLRNEYTGIFGYRSKREDGKIRAFIEKIVCILLRIYFGRGVCVPDANAPFRLMNVNSVKKYLYKLPNDFNIPNIMITAYFAYYQEKICFKKISFKARRGGVNYINMSHIIKIGICAMKDFNNFRRQL